MQHPTPEAAERAAKAERHALVSYLASIAPNHGSALAQYMEAYSEHVVLQADDPSECYSAVQMYALNAGRPEPIFPAYGDDEIGNDSGSFLISWSGEFRAPFSEAEDHYGLRDAAPVLS